jgi:5'-nucleotidase
MKPKKILVTNDDGINAVGLMTLADALKGLGEVWVVAPDRDRSGTSHTLTLNTPVRLDKININGAERIYSTDGTPGDCVYLTVSHLLADATLDLVVSGINHGFNLADDITYSGTVGAALEAVLLDVPAIAISVANANQKDLYTAKNFARDLSTMILEESYKLPRGVLLNVNIPKGVTHNNYKITTVGRRSYSKDVRHNLDPKGRAYYWIGGDPLQHDSIPGSDCNTVLDECLISVTPIHVDMTHSEARKRLESITLPSFNCVT